MMEFFGQVSRSPVARSTVLEGAAEVLEDVARLVNGAGCLPESCVAGCCFCCGLLWVVVGWLLLLLLLLLLAVVASRDCQREVFKRAGGRPRLSGTPAIGPPQPHTPHARCASKRALRSNGRSWEDQQHVKRHRRLVSPAGRRRERRRVVDSRRTHRRVPA